MHVIDKVGVVDGDQRQVVADLGHGQRAGAGGRVGMPYEQVVWQTHLLSTAIEVSVKVGVSCWFCSEAFTAAPAMFSVLMAVCGTSIV